MKAVSASRREQVRAMLADLKMPGALEAVDSVLSDADGGGVTTAEAIERLLGATDHPEEQPPFAGGHAFVTLARRQDAR